MCNGGPCIPNDEHGDRCILVMTIDRFEDCQTISKSEAEMLKTLKGLRSITEIERMTDREFDINLQGTYQGDDPVNFVSWLPLMFIYQYEWTILAWMSDYPEMVVNGDWSGIRDSSSDSKWDMFNSLRAAVKVL